MADHKSALKRVKRDEATRLRNRYQHKTVCSAVRELRTLEDQEEVRVLFPKVVPMVDKLAKRNIIHTNKATNSKSGLAKHLNKLAK